MSALQGKVALVTGGSKGIGFAIASALAREGAQVVVCSRSRLQSRAAAAQIVRAGGRALGMTCDVSRERHVANLVKSTVREFGKIDVLVANAAVLAPLVPVADMHVAEWDALFDINVRGVMLCMKYVLPHMIEQNYGRVQLLGSGLDLAGQPTTAAYAASKAAVVSMARVMAAELAQRDILVNVHYPGDIQTDMNPGGKRHPEDAVPCAMRLATLPAGGPSGKIFHLDREELIEIRDVAGS